MKTRARVSGSNRYVELPRRSKWLRPRCGEMPAHQGLGRCAIVRAGPDSPVMAVAEHDYPWSLGQVHLPYGTPTVFAPSRRRKKQV